MERAENYICGVFFVLYTKSGEKYFQMQNIWNSSIFITRSKPAQRIVHGYTKNYENGEFYSLILFVYYNAKSAC